jgi:geranylgeranyl diphosphate synthase type I
MKETDIRSTIQREMRAAFPAVEERVARFYAMQEYHLGWRDTDLQPSSFDPGKLLRPQLTLMTCQAVGGSIEQALPLAAGIQLIHDFSLIHDDIEDVSDTRRGRVTVWKQWGVAQGINVGDGMFVVAHLSIHRMAERGVPAETTLDVLRRFDETILTICEGQFLDLSFEGNLSISEDDYLAMIGRKTAVLIGGAAGLGAIVGGATPESVAAFFDFGRNLGLAFQIQDDIIGIWGDPAITGKPRAADIYRRKVSLPIVHALRHASSSSELAAIYQHDEVSNAAVERVLAVLNEAASRSYSEEVAAAHHNQALEALGRVQPGANPSAQTALAHIGAMAEKLLGRQA